MWCSVSVNDNLKLINELEAFHACALTQTTHANFSNDLRVCTLVILKKKFKNTLISILIERFMTNGSKLEFGFGFC